MKVTAEMIDARAVALIEEFRQHAHGVRQLPGNATADQRKMFEGWCIQKLASLQLIVEQQADLLQLAMNR